MEIKKLFSKDTRIGRTVRTFLQAIIGIAAFVLGILNIPGVYDYLVANSLVSGGTLALTIAVATYLYNAAESFLKWLVGEGN
jgi:hypothetical protein